MRHRPTLMPRLSQGRFTSNHARFLTGSCLEFSQLVFLLSRVWTGLRGSKFRPVSLDDVWGNGSSSAWHPSSPWFRTAARHVLFWLCKPLRSVFCEVCSFPCFIRPTSIGLPFICRPEIRRDYPLNLSISVSGGKETNKDSLSSGERSGKSPAPNPLPVR